MEVLYQLTPVMGLTLLLLSLAHERLWSTLPASPYFATLFAALLTLLLIFAGGLIAFGMVVAEFALIANTSALTFMVAGTFKEIVTGAGGAGGGGAGMGGWVERCAGRWGVGGCVGGAVCLLVPDGSDPPSATPPPSNPSCPPLPHTPHTHGACCPLAPQSRPQCCS